MFSFFEKANKAFEDTVSKANEFLDTGLLASTSPKTQEQAPQIPRAEASTLGYYD